MKRKIASLLIMALIFTSSFGMNMSYVSAATTNQSLDLFMEFIPGDTWSTWPTITDEDYAQARTEEGVEITMPYGYITDINGGAYDHFVYVGGSVPDGSDVRYLDLPYDVDDGERYYGEEVYLKDVASDGKFTYVINATLKNGTAAKYTFHFVEDAGESLMVNYLYASYYDENGNSKSIDVLNESDLTTLKDGCTLKLPYYYDNSKGFKFDVRGSGCIIKADFAEKYTLKNDKANIVLTCTSANGKNTIDIPVTVVRDKVDTAAELESVVVSVYEYYDDETYIDEKYPADISAVNCKNEIYAMIPSYFECYYPDDTYCEDVDIEDVTGISLEVDAKDSARIKSTYYEDGESWTEFNKYYYEDLTDFEYEGCMGQDVKVEVHSPNSKVVKTYTIKVIVSDCGGDHYFSAWETEKAATCTADGRQMHKCRYCAYKEYKVIPMTGHNFVTTKAVAATCTKSGKTEGKQCSKCKKVMTAQKVLPAKGHKYGAYKTTTYAGFGKKGVQTAKCQNEGCTSKKTKSIAALKTPILSKAAYTFDNKAKKPTVTVKNTAGAKVSCTATYASGRKAVGKYAVKVTVNNTNYKGTKTVYFKINPKGAANVKLTKGKKQFTVSWSKPNATYRKQITGYQIKYATTSAKLKNAKPVTIKGSSVKSKTIKKLNAKKKYYVQVRTYKTVDGTKYYSAWSAKKSVVTK